MNVLLQDLNGVLSFNDYFNDILVVSVAFHLFIIFIPDFKLANPKALDNCLEIFDLADRCGAECEDAEANPLLLHLLDDPTVCVLASRPVSLIDDKQHDLLHID